MVAIDTATCLPSGKTDRQPVGDQLPTGRLNLLTQVAKRTGCCMSYLKACDIEINPRSVADYWSPTSQQLVARGRMEISVGNWSPIKPARRLVGNHLATYATNSVAASLLCMFKRQRATDFNRRLVGDFKKTFP